MDHAVELADRGGDLLVLGLAHAQAGDHVARLQRRGQPVSAGVGQHDAQHPRLDPLHVVDVAAHLVGGDGHGRQVEARHLRQPPRQQGLLDGPGLAQLRGQRLLAQLEVHRRADGAQQHHQVVLAAVVADAQAQDVGGIAPDQDRRAVGVAELQLHVGVPARGLRRDHPHPAPLDVAHHLVVPVHGLAGDRGTVLADALDQQVVALALPVQASADHAVARHVRAVDQGVEDVAEGLLVAGRVVDLLEQGVDGPVELLLHDASVRRPPGAVGVGRWFRAQSSTSAGRPTGRKPRRVPGAGRPRTGRSGPAVLSSGDRTASRAPLQRKDPPWTTPPASTE